MPIEVQTGGPISAPVARRTILDIIQDVCPLIGVKIPSTVFSMDDRLERELAAVANEMAQRIATDTRDWSKLKVQATIDGDGEAESFALPDDYARMLKKGGIYSSTQPGWQLEPVADTDDWLKLDIQNYTVAPGRWTMIGDELFIKPVLPAGASVSFFYLSNLFALDANNAAKAQFTEDTDFYRLDPRVLKLGIIWQWKANKGLPYQEDMATYEEALAVSSGNERGSIKVVMGGSRIRGDIRPSYPWPLG